MALVNEVFPPAPFFKIKLKLFAMLLL